MVKDAESHAGEDKKKKEEITTHNETDQLIYQTEKNLKEMGENLEPDVKAKVEAALERAKEAMKGSDINEIISARDGLNAAWHEAAQKLYAQTNPQGAPGGPGGQPGPEPQAEQQQSSSAGDKTDSGAVDADYEVVD